MKKLIYFVRIAFSGMAQRCDNILKMGVERLDVTRLEEIWRPGSEED